MFQYYLTFHDFLYMCKIFNLYFFYVISLFFTKSRVSQKIIIYTFSNIFVICFSLKFNNWLSYSISLIILKMYIHVCLYNNTCYIYICNRRLFLMYILFDRLTYM